MRLPYDHRLYFELGPASRVEPISRLVPSKPPGSQPGSEAKAAELMAEAAAGRRPRRGPLEVRAEGELLRVVDGNATFAVAVASGWPDVPVTEARP